MPVIPVMRKLKQEDSKFEGSLGCIVRLSKNQNKHLEVIRSTAFSNNMFYWIFGGYRVMNWTFSVTFQRLCKRFCLTHYHSHTQPHTQSDTLTHSHTTHTHTHLYTCSHTHTHTHILIHTLSCAFAPATLTHRHTSVDFEERYLTSTIFFKFLLYLFVIPKSI